jgi:hypothetical protein
MTQLAGLKPVENGCLLAVSRRPPKGLSERDASRDPGHLLGVGRACGWGSGANPLNGQLFRQPRGRLPESLRSMRGTFVPQVGAPHDDRSAMLLELCWVAACGSDKEKIRETT